MAMKLKANKSLLAPKADEFSSIQLNFLLINMPFTVIINNYKSSLFHLDILRNLIISYNGFSYHPNKNVKTRAFGGFSTVLSPSTLNGLVVFAFFKNYEDSIQFLNSLNNSVELSTLSYFSLLTSGHLIQKHILNTAWSTNNNKMVLPVNTLFSVFNKTTYHSTFSFFPYLINKINFILNAYIKPIN